MSGPASPEKPGQSRHAWPGMGAPNAPPASCRGWCMNARKWENVKTEIYGKVWLYSHLIYMAVDNGYGTARVVCPSVKPAPKTARQEGRQ